MAESSAGIGIAEANVRAAAAPMKRVMKTIVEILKGRKVTVEVFCV
jgi:hypothetical protein